MHSFVCVCTEIEAGTNELPSAMVLLNWQKSVARLTGVEGEEEGEEEGAGNRAARKTIDGQSEQERERAGGSDFLCTLFRMRVLIMPYYIVSSKDNAGI